MTEGKWHKEVREKIYEKLKESKFPVYTSHSKISKLELYRGEVERKNCLSDADIIVFDSKNKKIQRIIEIENDINPKKIMGIILATHFCDTCRIMEVDYPLKNISLMIILRKPKEKSKKPQKLKLIEKSLKDIIKNTKGCIYKFELKEQELAAELSFLMLK